MRKIAAVMLLALCFSNSGEAQKPRFNSVTSVGLLTGQSETSLSLETLNGIRFSNWATALGAGLDFYQYRSAPVFANVRWYFGSEKKLFLFGSGGYNFPLKNKPDRSLGNFSYYYFSGGVYADGGIGYSLFLNKRTSLVFGLGYSLKEIKLHSSYSICGIVPPCWEEHERYEMNYRRIIMKMGIAF